MFGVFCLLFCCLSFVVFVVSDGQSSDRTFESTNGSKSQGTMIATIVMMSAAKVQKKISMPEISYMAGVSPSIAMRSLRTAMFETNVCGKPLMLCLSVCAIL